MPLSILEWLQTPDSWACIFGSGLKLVFQWKAIYSFKVLQFYDCSFIVIYSFQSLFKSLTELWMSWATESKTEAAIRGGLSKNVFLEILQNSQGNNCAGVSFLIKVFSCEFCEISKNTLLQNNFRRLLLVRKYHQQF